jgi:hypothetical protein
MPVYQHHNMHPALIVLLLDIAYLTIHVDAGAALAFTQHKNLPPRHLPLRHFGEMSQNAQHNIVR